MRRNDGSDLRREAVPRLFGKQSADVGKRGCLLFRLRLLRFGFCGLCGLLRLRGLLIAAEQISQRIGNTDKDFSAVPQLLNFRRKLTHF